MSNKKCFFLSVDEALDAIQNALLQYPAQVNLLSLLLPMVFGPDAYLVKASGRQPIWVKIPGEKKLIPSSEADLKQRIIDRLKRSPPSLELLVQVSAHVFGVRAQAVSDSDPSSPKGLRIDTDMTGFTCIQCGHCCQTLNYHDGCNASDVQRWVDLGRTDILDWVGTVRQNGRVSAYRIWMVPGTNQFAKTCPWLKASPDMKHYACTIHDVRPTICRQYPGSRKHARMTGCKGV